MFLRLVCRIVEKNNNTKSQHKMNGKLFSKYEREMAIQMRCLSPMEFKQKANCHYDICRRLNSRTRKREKGQLKRGKTDRGNHRKSTENQGIFSSVSDTNLSCFSDPKSLYFLPCFPFYSFFFSFHFNSLQSNSFAESRTYITLTHVSNVEEVFYASE